MYGNETKETKDPQNPGNPGETPGIPTVLLPPRTWRPSRPSSRRRRRLRPPLRQPWPRRTPASPPFKPSSPKRSREAKRLPSSSPRLRAPTPRPSSKYLDAVKLANPTIPGDVIAGGTIEDIDASVAKAVSIATAVKANLEAQAKEAKVPAGAPTRGEISLEGLTPREKIAAGIQQKGGT